MNPKNTAIIMISLLICLPAVSLHAASKDIEKEFNRSKALPFYKKGNDYLKDGICDRAIEEYSKAAELEPDYYGIYNKLGYALYYSGRFKEALDYFRKSFSLNRGNVDTMLGLANVYMVLRQEPEARIYFEKVIEIDPGNVAPYMPLALIYNNEKRFDESALLAKKVLERYPRYDPAYLLLAQNQELLNEPDPAIKNYKSVIELKPGHVKAYLGLARCYMLKAKYNTAYNYAKIVQKLRSGIKEADDIVHSLKKRFREDKKARLKAEAARKAKIKKPANVARPKR